MKNIAAELNGIVASHGEALKKISEENSSIPYAPGKWSKKEELGHLIDSAHNNLRRFIVSQTDQEPHIVYAQDEWVKINAYQAQPMSQLIQLWTLLNLQIAQVLSYTSDAAAQRQCNTGKTKPELHSVKWLAEDYLKHMRHHLHHILDLEPVAY